jgi:hypothetical protein
MFPVNEVAPDSPAAPYLYARFAAALSFADRNRTDRLCTGPVSRPDRCAPHFGRSRVLVCGFFLLQISRRASSTRIGTNPTGFIWALSTYSESDVSRTSPHLDWMLLRRGIALAHHSADPVFRGGQLSIDPIRRAAHEGAFRR